MKVYIGSDHAGFELKNKLVKYLEKQGFETLDLGTDSKESVDYPDYAFAVAGKVQKDKQSIGILICDTGIGMSIAANKKQGIRAALIHDKFGAERSRQHNDANVICFGGSVVSAEKAKKLLKIFMETKSSTVPRHKRRVKKLNC